uniref:Uncharacterized protein n=1 Tax=Nelumbo nucifera TaxID=4432 RepID=A0A822XPC4_NELNU|nr:TPA_asm: hypothetical protein HUJ06_022382 [Nelumbo nucifera]
MYFCLSVLFCSVLFCSISIFKPKTLKSLCCDSDFLKPETLVQLILLIGTKLQHVIATLALESAGVTGSFTGTNLRPRDDLFWFKRPELQLTLIHFVVFQNAFELASFFWFWVYSPVISSVLFWK